jgi:hypothetical protein
MLVRAGRVYSPHLLVDHVLALSLLALTHVDVAHESAGTLSHFSYGR